MNKKGQALVEFVIVIPIIIMILFAMIDFGLIIFNKNEMENKLNDIAEMIYNEENNESINKFINSDTNLKTTYNVEKEKYTKVQIFRAYTFITPGFNKIFGEPYKIEVSRVVYEK